MNWNAQVRRVHRWLSIAFTLAVVANLVAMALGTSAVWVGLLALAPLIALMITGLYLFALPYASRWGGGRAAAGSTERR